MIPSSPFIEGSSDVSPPIPEGVNLQSMRWFKLDIVNLLNSDFMQLASPEEFKAAFLLWTKSIHQVPGGSLPNDEAVLAMLAGGYDYRRKSWQRIREMALYGWTLCSDGRLYHPTVAETVLGMLDSSTKERQRDGRSDDLRNADRIREQNRLRQQRFKERRREQMRGAQVASAEQMPIADTVTPPISDEVTLPITPEVTLPLTQVTLPYKERDKDIDKDNVIGNVTDNADTVTGNAPTPLPAPPSSTREGVLCQQLRALGVRAAPHMTVVQEMCAHHSDEHILAAAEIALEKKGSGIHVGYIAAMLKNSWKPKGIKNKAASGPPNRQLIPPVVVNGSHYTAL
ncbi:DUF1376 domain-containing protein [Acidithiobacillus sp.]|uniref:DUF1376 domain-containing protein n=1 Tax=Acidithiobacillus sp. TaxID=1872118 RepID=UPI003D05250B